MKNIGTTDALNKITDIIYRNLDKRKPTIVTFIDLAKAFDTVNHELLLQKLEKYSIRGSILELIKSYLSGRQQKVKIDDKSSEVKIIDTGVPHLSGRQQKVKIDDKSSEVKIIDTGVPQGTILGPLFFTIYMNDLLYTYKYLGIIFDYNMKWYNDIEHIINKTKYLIFIFAKLRKYMDINTLTKIYYASSTV